MKRVLTRGRRFCHRKGPGTDSLKGREGLGRAGWGRRCQEGDRRMGQGRVSKLRPQQSGCCLPLTELLQVLMHYMSFLFKSIVHLSANLRNVMYVPW